MSHQTCRSAPPRSSSASIDASGSEERLATSLGFETAGDSLPSASPRTRRYPYDLVDLEDLRCDPAIGPRVRHSGELDDEDRGSIDSADHRSASSKILSSRFSSSTRSSPFSPDVQEPETQFDLEASSSVNLPELCSRCEELLTGRKLIGAYKSEDHVDIASKHHDIRSLLTSAQSGCLLCTVILEGIRSSPFISVQEALSTATSQSLLVYSLWPGKGGEGYVVRFHLDDLLMTDVRLTGTDAPRTRLETSTGSQTTMRMLKDWLRKCDVLHDCQPITVMSEPCSRSQSHTPTRLIEVSDPVVLRDSADLPGNTRYAALSYCWGNVPAESVVKLTETTLAQFQKAIPVGSLPRTIQDAICVARMLDTPYIWVDSICIVQDSRVDWLRESARMADVYGNAYYTLAATASSGSEDGLFRHRLPALSTLHARWTGDVDPGYYVCWAGDEWGTKVSNAPLNGRGWVFQERLLSPRVIHFAENKVFWSCEEACSSETIVKYMSLESLDFGSGLTKRIWLSGSEPDGWEVFELRHRLVHQYSFGQFSHGTDKLIALSGIAQQIDHLFHGRYKYLAGLWDDGMDDLIWQLLWENSRTNVSHARSPDYRAPSWSWASIDGAIRFNCPRGLNSGWESGVFFPCIDILKAYTTTVLQHEFGAVTDGRVRVRGRLLPVQLQLLYARDRNGRLLAEAWIQLSHQKKERYHIWVNLDETLESGSPVEKRLYCIPIEGAIQGAECAVTGLLIVESRSGPWYQRFGLFKKWDDHKLYDRLVVCCQPDDMILPHCEEAAAKAGRRTFTIV